MELGGTSISTRKNESTISESKVETSISGWQGSRCWAGPSRSSGPGTSSFFQFSSSYCNFTSLSLSASRRDESPAPWHGPVHASLSLAVPPRQCRAPCRARRRPSESDLRQSESPSRTAAGPGHDGAAAWQSRPARGRVPVRPRQSPGRPSPSQLDS